MTHIAGPRTGLPSEEEPTAVPKDPAPVGTREPSSESRRLDGPRLALTAIQIGPGLMLLGVVVVAGDAVAGVPHDAQHRQRAEPVRRDRHPRDGATARHRHPRHRPVGRLDAGAGRGRGRARLRSMPSGPAGHRRDARHRRRSGRSTGSVFVWGRLPHPFIVTLATLSIARGLALWLSGGQPIRGCRTSSGDRRRIASAGCRTRPSSSPAWRCIGLLLTTRLVWGRWIYAVGGNPEARGGPRSRSTGC